MKPFCEIVVMRVLPVLRALLAQELEKMGYTQVEIAKLLHTTQPAISQYRRRLRGKAAMELFEKNETLLNEVKRSASNLVRKRSDFAEEICRLCTFVRENNILCAICPELTRSERGDCGGCEYYKP